MKLRELLIGIGFKVNEQNINAVESKIGKIKKNLSEVGTASTRAADMTSKGMATVGNASERAKQKTESAFSGIESKARGANEELHKMDSTLTGLKNKFVGALAFLGVSFSLGNIIRMVDEYKTISGQVKLVTSSQKEAVSVQKDLYQMAQRTRQEYGATAQLYTSVARNASELGKSTSEILAFTEDVSMAMMIGGGSAASQQAALVQLGQALGSGVLRGDELNSIMEQAPRLSKLIAEGMGTTVGQLRVLGKEGQLTAIDVFDAIRKSSEKLKREMGKIPWTVNQAGVRVSNALGNLFSKLEKKTGVVSSIAKGFASIGDYIDNIDIDNFVAGFRLLVIYASAFLLVSKWSAIIRVAEILRGIILGIRNAYLAATGAQVAFQLAGAKSALLALVAMGKFLLIAAVIALIILAIQDFYTWIQGGDSIIGRHLGKWEEFVTSCKTTWDTATQSIKDFLNMRVIDILSLAIDKIGEFQDKIAKLNVRKRVGEWWDENVSDPANKFVFGVLNGAHVKGPQLSPSQQEAYLGKGLLRTSNRNFADNRTNINNVSVYAKTNATPAEIGVGVVNAITPANGYEFDLDSGFGYGFPDVEDN